MTSTLTALLFFDVISATISTVKITELIVDVILAKTVPNQGPVCGASFDCNFGVELDLILEFFEKLPSASELRIKM